MLSLKKSNVVPGDVISTYAVMPKKPDVYIIQSVTRNAHNEITAVVARNVKHKRKLTNLHLDFAIYVFDDEMAREIRNRE